MKTKISRAKRIAAVLLATCCAGAAQAAFDASKVLRESAAVAARYPDPAVSYGTPAFAPGRSDFTSHAEMLAFAQALAKSSPHVKLEMLGSSQRGLALPLVSLTADGTVNPRLPTVLVIGQQHGNEPSGGEAALALMQQFAVGRAAVLERVNLLLIPRGNPDGAENFTRVTAGGIDVNRDHLLLNTPEGRAIALAVARYRPQVVLDLHEFTVGGRWVEKFNGLVKYDALLQSASVGNLDPLIAEHAQKDFVDRVAAVLRANGLSSFAYHTTASSSPDDKTVSMGGVQADTGRNVAGLRPAISMLIEVRGVGLGRAHLLRRVHTQVLAATTVIETAAAQGTTLVGLVRDAGLRNSAASCHGDLIVEATHTPEQKLLTFLDPLSGQDRPVQVSWRAADPLRVLRRRPRPCGYLFDAGQKQTIDRLRELGVRLQAVARASRWEVERYAVTAEDDGKRQDARGAIEDDQPIRKLQVRTDRASEVVAPGVIYVPMDQPLAALVAAALEPDSQNSYVANRLLDLDVAGLRRVLRKPAAADLDLEP